MQTSPGVSWADRVGRLPGLAADTERSLHPEEPHQRALSPNWHTIGIWGRSDDPRSQVRTAPASSRQMPGPEREQGAEQGDDQDPGDDQGPRPDDVTEDSDDQPEDQHDDG